MASTGCELCSLVGSSPRGIPGKREKRMVQVVELGTENWQSRMCLGRVDETLGGWKADWVVRLGSLN